MKVNIYARKLTLKDAEKDAISKKVSRLGKFFDDSAESNVVVAEQRDRMIVEVTIFSGDMIYRAEQRDDELLVAVDNNIEAIERQIRKNKTRLAKRLRTGLDIAAPDAFSVPADEDEGDSEIRIVRTKTHHVKPMHPEEAVLQMNLVGHEFYIFLNAETDNTAIVYKRKQGDYGLIDVE
ncbi:MAG: ribosome-associated translation inhibitor RaiA [Oscillospiraceae bacterium]|nr:ribosome-associated translation inhibitor RaiA [Oscillospiraceae bacterium]